MSLAFKNARKLLGTLNFSEYKPDNTGVTSVSALLVTALQDAMTQKKRLKIDLPGTYKLDTVVNPTMTADLQVSCVRGVTFKAGLTLNNRLFFFSKITGDDIRFEWVGGKTDMSLVGLGGVGTAWDHFYIGERFHRVDVERVHFYSGADYEQNHGDSGMFCVAKSARIVYNTFEGIWDAGVYLSGDQAQTNGKHAYVGHNDFMSCSVGVISKRQFKRCIVAHNFLDKCATAIATGEAAPTLLPGKKNIIIANHIVRPRDCGIQVAIADSSIVTANHIVDQGYDLAGVAVSSSFGIALKGSKNCVISNNIVEMEDLVTAGTAHRGIQLERRTYNGIDYDSTGNLVSVNRITDVSQGLRENDVNQDFNRWLNNVVTGATSVSIKAGANSYWEEFDSATAGRKAFVGTLSLGGQFNQESLRVIPVPGAVDFVAILAGTGTALVQATGASGDIDLRLLSKGTNGRVKYGTFTANADAPITGYVEIKTDDGTVRKLAVIA